MAISELFQSLEEGFDPLEDVPGKDHQGLVAIFKVHVGIQGRGVDILLQNPFGQSGAAFTFACQDGRAGQCRFHESLFRNLFAYKPHSRGLFRFDFPARVKMSAVRERRKERQATPAPRQPGKSGFRKASFFISPMKRMRTSPMAFGPYFLMAAMMKSRSPGLGLRNPSHGLCLSGRVGRFAL
jgi:hypothetical protein